MLHVVTHSRSTIFERQRRKPQPVDIDALGSTPPISTSKPSSPKVSSRPHAVANFATIHSEVVRKCHTFLDDQWHVQRLRSRVFRDSGEDQNQQYHVEVLQFFLVDVLFLFPRSRCPAKRIAVSFLSCYFRGTPVWY